MSFDKIHPSRNIWAMLAVSIAGSILIVQKPDGWFTDVWETWFPKVKGKYYALMEYLGDKYKLGPAYLLCSTHPKLPFMASTVNLGPQTVTLPHYDAKNLATGLCGIMPFGSFDSSKGGHLGLHEPRVVLELAPGLVVPMPSAVIQHSNLPVVEGTRYSITTYTAGQLFAWMESGGPLKSLSPDAKDAYFKEGPERWETGWSQYPGVVA